MIHRDELLLLEDCFDFCKKVYHSPVTNLRIVLSPIKCVYSSDYHLIGDTFIFSSGTCKSPSVIHELLHHVVHPRVLNNKEIILANARKYPGIDDSYYLSGNDDGRINAFKEFLVRSLTKTFFDRTTPTDLGTYIVDILETSKAE